MVDKAAQPGHADGSRLQIPQTPTVDPVVAALRSAGAVNPESWPKIISMFQEIIEREKGLDNTRDSHYKLCVWWEPEGWNDGKKYQFFDANKEIEELFRNAAESAGVELGYPGGEAAIFAWLDLLRCEAVNVKGGPSKGALIIERISDTSMRCAVRCETNAKAEARLRLEAAEVPADPKELLGAGGLAESPVRRRGRGRPADVELNSAIVRIVRRYGDAWKDYLNEIAKALDNEQVEFINSPRWLEKKITTWTDAEVADRPRLIQVIKDRLVWAAQNPGSVSEHESAIAANSTARG